MRFLAGGTAAVSALIVVFYLYGISSRDPGSFFFDQNTAYARRYSSIRQEQAEHFIKIALTTPGHGRSATPVPLCVGIPSIARDNVRYLGTTVGSLLQGLSSEERDGIHLVVFIAHTEPSVHPTYQEAWLEHLTDEVLLYNLSQAELSHVKELEKDHALHREKGLFDYNYLLKRCYATGASNVAILEDDVVAMDGWYHRLVAGIKQAEAKSVTVDNEPDYLYLRMFYTEEFLGWNGEDWPTHVSWSLMVVILSVLLVHGLRSSCPGTTRFLTIWVSAGICFVCVPLGIVLFFAAGKTTMLPLTPGINKMNNYGCCAQGLVYPRHKVPQLIEWFEATRIGFADMLVEQYANDHHEQRWALTPSVLQHVGMKSSKKDDSGFEVTHSRTAAETIWNFAFEMNDVETLRQEHALAILNDVTL
jgi:hypothetical protein